MTIHLPSKLGHKVHFKYYIKQFSIYYLLTFIKNVQWDWMICEIPCREASAGLCYRQRKITHIFLLINISTTPGATTTAKLIEAIRNSCYNNDKNKRNNIHGDLSLLCAHFSMSVHRHTYTHRQTYGSEWVPESMRSWEHRIREALRGGIPTVWGITSYPSCGSNGRGNPKFK